MPHDIVTGNNSLSVKHGSTWGKWRCSVISLQVTIVYQWNVDQHGVSGHAPWYRYRQQFSICETWINIGWVAMLLDIATGDNSLSVKHGSTLGKWRCSVISLQATILYQWNMDQHGVNGDAPWYRYRQQFSISETWIKMGQMAMPHDMATGYNSLSVKHGSTLGKWRCPMISLQATILYQWNMDQHGVNGCAPWYRYRQQFSISETWIIMG